MTGLEQPEAEAEARRDRAKRCGLNVRVYIAFLLLLVGTAGIAASSPVLAQIGLTITGVTDSPDSFAPSGDPAIDDTDIRFTLSEDADVTVTWDGLDDAGSVVPDAYSIEAVDAAGNSAVPGGGDVLVDTRPALVLTSPAAGTVLNGTVRTPRTRLLGGPP